MRTFTIRAIHRINVVRPVCNHLVGTNHTFRHRAIVGTVFMITGVGITSAGHVVEGGFIIHEAAELIGAAVHGIGLTPFIEAMMVVGVTKVNK